MCWGTAGTNRRPRAVDGSDARSKPSRKIDGVSGRHRAAYISDLHAPVPARVILSCFRSSSRAPLESSFHLQTTRPLLVDLSLLLFLILPMLPSPALETSHSRTLRLTVLFLKVGPQIRCRCLTLEHQNRR